MLVLLIIVIAAFVIMRKNRKVKNRISELERVNKENSLKIEKLEMKFEVFKENAHSDQIKQLVAQIENKKRD